MCSSYSGGAKLYARPLDQSPDQFAVNVSERVMNEYVALPDHSDSGCARVHHTQQHQEPHSRVQHHEPHSRVPKVTKPNSEFEVDPNIKNHGDSTGATD